MDLPNKLSYKSRKEFLKNIEAHPNLQIGKSVWMMEYAGNCSILFDIPNKFTEEEPSYEDDGREKIPPKFNHYRAHMMYLNKEDKIPKDQFGKPMPSDEYGFRLSSRIAPRYLKGVVLRDPEYDVVRSVVSLMKDNNTYLPIYGLDGKMLWPKKMSYEEVVEFTKEKEKEEENK